MTNTPTQQEEIQRLVNYIEDSLMETELCKDCLNCAENDEYCVYHQKLFALPRALMERTIVLEKELQALKTRNAEGIEKMYSKMNELDTPKRGELHLLLLSLFS